MRISPTDFLVEFAETNELLHKFVIATILATKPPRSTLTAPPAILAFPGTAVGHPETPEYRVTLAISWRDPPELLNPALRTIQVLRVRDSRPPNIEAIVDSDISIEMAAAGDVVSVIISRIHKA